MPGLENMHINELKEFLQMIFETIKQTHSGSENEKDLLVLRNFLNIIENSDFINSATRSKTTVFTKTSLQPQVLRHYEPAKGWRGNVAIQIFLDLIAVVIIIILVGITLTSLKRNNKNEETKNRR